MKSSSLINSSEEILKPKRPLNMIMLFSLHKQILKKRNASICQTQKL